MSDAELKVLYFVANHNLFSARITKECPKEEYVVEGMVKWKDEYQVNIISLNFGLETISQNQHIKKSHTGSFLPLIKSNLQKQVRRMDVRSVSTAQKFMEINMFEFLRRVPVIAIEDSLFCKELSYVVWLMAAVSKKKRVPEKSRLWLLGVIHSLTICKNCSRIECKNKRCYNKHEKDLSFDKILDSSHCDKEIIASIVFRTTYGGLWCDPIMISKCCHHFLIEEETKLPQLNVKLWEDKLPDFNILVWSADFHVYPYIIDQITKKWNWLSPENVKRAIWDHASGFNDRYSVPKKSSLSVWKIIRLYYVELANKNKLRTLNEISQF